MPVALGHFARVKNPCYEPIHHRDETTTPAVRPIHPNSVLRMTTFRCSDRRFIATWPIAATQIDGTPKNSGPATAQNTLAPSSKYSHGNGGFSDSTGTVLGSSTDSNSSAPTCEH